jgi:HlyD family secretion protein
MKAPTVVSATPVSRRDVVATFEASGSIEAPFNVKLSAKSPGRIEFLQVREGDRVQAGQVLVRLDSSDIEAEVAREKALLSETQSRLAQALLNQNPTNTAVMSTIREREADLASAEADRDQVVQNSASRKAAMRAAVDDAESRIRDADATIMNSEAGIRSAQANLDNAKSKLNRVTDLYKQGFISPQEVDDAKTTVSVQEQDVEVARGKLNAAQAQRTSMVAQRDAAQKQYDIGLVTTVSNQKAAHAKV